MNKKLFFAVGICTAVTCVFGGARIDLDGNKESVGIDFKNPAAGKITAADWRSKPNPGQYLIFEIPATEKWQDFSFQFTPAKTGKVRLSLAGNWAAEAKDRATVLFDDISVEGLRNGNFEDLHPETKHPRVWWSPGGGASIVVDAESKSNAIMVNNSKAIFQDIGVEAGKEYTVRGRFKLAPAQ